MNDRPDARGIVARHGHRQSAAVRYPPKIPLINAQYFSKRFHVAGTPCTVVLGKIYPLPYQIISALFQIKRTLLIVGAIKLRSRSASSPLVEKHPISINYDIVD